MKEIVKANLAFLLPYALYLTIGGIIIFINTKADTHIAINSFHMPAFDWLAPWVTSFGEGVIVALVFVMLLAIKFRYAFIVGAANLLSAGFTQALKHTVFEDVVRPKKFFEGLHELYFVPGVDNWEYHSFPSGHTTCAFALYFSLSLIVKNRIYKFIFFAFALTVGYSRIYLSQHFFEDVYAGSMVGTLTSMLVYWFIMRKPRPKLEGSLVTLFNK